MGLGSRKQRAGFSSRQGVYESPRPSSTVPSLWDKMSHTSGHHDYICGHSFILGAVLFSKLKWGLSGNDVFQPHFPQKTSPAEFRAFRHGLFCGRCLFPCCSSHFRAQKPLVADFGSALFSMRPSPRFSLRIYVFYRAENGGIYLCSGQLHTA